MENYTFVYIIGKMGVYNNKLNELCFFLKKKEKEKEKRLNRPLNLIWKCNKIIELTKSLISSLNQINHAIISNN